MTTHRFRGRCFWVLAGQPYLTKFKCNGEGPQTAARAGSATAASYKPNWKKADLGVWPLRRKLTVRFCREAEFAFLRN